MPCSGTTSRRSGPPFTEGKPPRAGPRGTSANIPRKPGDPPGQVTRASPSQSQPELPPALLLPYSPRRSPLRPFAHHQPDHGGQHTPGRKTRSRSPPTPEQCRGTRGATAARSQSHTPPCAARSVFVNDDTDSTHGGPSRRQRRPMSPTAEPQRWAKRPRTELTQIPLVLFRGPLCPILALNRGFGSNQRWPMVTYNFSRTFDHGAPTCMGFLLPMARF